MRIIPYETIKAAVTMEDLFEPIRQVFIDYNSPKLIGIPVNLLHFANNADAHIKLAAIDGYPYFSIKVATMFPENAAKNIEPYNGAVFLFDANTGEPKVILNDRGILTDLRTAVAGAVITDFAAAKNAENVAVIGTGIQAFHQVLALSKLRKINTLAIYGRNAENAILLKTKFLKEDLANSINIVKTTDAAVKTSDIIITTTPSKLPLVKGEWLKNGQHITAIGADDTFKHEIDLVCFQKADTVFIDSLELNRQFGEYASALKNCPEVADKTVEFGEAFQNEAFENRGDKITVAKLVGVGVQDLAAATVVMHKLGNVL